MATDTTVELIFVDEPPPAQPRGNRSPVVGWLQSLKDHPGRWAKYPTPFMSNFNTAKINSGGGTASWPVSSKPSPAGSPTSATSSTPATSATR